MVRQRNRRGHTRGTPSFSDLAYFAEHALKLRPKAGPLESFAFNAAQLKLHEIAEKQKAETGRVRLIVLKARQLGI